VRADAIRNRNALLDAARAEFQLEGLGAQIDAIAAKAGVGVGTLYRHFPTKEALLSVLVQEHLDRLNASAEAAARAADPWDAVAGLIWAFAAFEAEDRGMLDILSQSAAQPDGAAAAVSTILTRLDVAVAQAQAAGLMRTDVSSQDVLLAVCGIGKITTTGVDGDEGRWKRLIAVTLDGLRAARVRPAPSRRSR
jgi:AcrR family transcriptional regulator